MNRSILKFAVIAIAAVIIAGCSQPAPSELLPQKWKFAKGDDPSFALPVYDDSGWDTIVPGTKWEQQGYANYDGFAWYRVTVTVPSSFRKEAETYGGMLLSLGMIDDADETFFNGEKVGSNGSMPPDYKGAYEARREYTVPAGLVKWDEPNVIAVRVYDFTGDGGIYSSPISLRSKGLPDLITLTPAIGPADRIFTSPGDIEIPVNLQNGSSVDFRGLVSLEIMTDMNEPVASPQQEVTVSGGSVETVTFNLPSPAPGFYKVTASVSSGNAMKKARFNFGCRPLEIGSPADPQPDFEEFWKTAKSELSSVSPQFRMIKIDSLCTENVNIYLVEMRSLGNALIRGWYRVPVKPGRYPAIMIVPGYSSTITPSYVNYGDDIIGFGLNIRGHGNSKDDVNPGFPGYILSGLDDKERYIYRGAYMDCVRGIDFLFSRPEVDKSRVAVEGASQGGALTFATAALNNDRIAVCVPQVPFLSDWRDYFRVAKWPANEFVNYVENEKKQTWDQVYTTLSYFDIKNLAPMIKAPMLMAVGLMDEVCPPHINFAAYNQVTSRKSYMVYPEAGHGLPSDFYSVKMKWIRKELGMEQDK